MAKKSAAQKSLPVVDEAEAIVEPAPAFLDAGVIIEPEVMRTAVEDSLPLDRVFPSPTNPRQDLGDLTELAESIKKAGILQPVLVRTKNVSLEHADPTVDEYELIFGHRRVAAAKLAGLTHIPARIIQLDDQQALELQLIENAQRRDISPLEEATAYRRLHDEFGLSADAIAQRVGKSKASVYARMKLGDLKAPAARNALADGTIDMSVALLVARLEEKDQAKAIALILKGDERSDFSGPLSFRASVEFLRNQFTLNVNGAPFDPKDATLVDGVGTCAACPKRVDANGVTVTGPIGDGDLCDDRECWNKKVDAMRAVQLAKKVKDGFRPLSAAENAKIVADWDPDRLNLGDGSKFARLGDQIRYEFTKNWSIRTQWEGALDQAAKKLALPQDDKDLRACYVAALDGNGKVHELVDAKAAWKLIKKAGVVKVKKPSSPSYGAPKPKVLSPEQRCLEGAKKHIENYLVDALTQEAKANPELDAKMLRFLISFGGWSYEYKDHLKRIGFNTKGQDSDYEALGKVSANTVRQLGVLAMLAAAGEDVSFAPKVYIEKDGKVKLQEYFAEVGKVLGVDVAAIETKATADVVRELAKLKDKGLDAAVKRVQAEGYKSQAIAAARLKKNPFKEIATEGRKAAKKLTAKPKAKK